MEEDRLEQQNNPEMVQNDPPARTGEALTLNDCSEALSACNDRGGRCKASNWLKAISAVGAETLLASSGLPLAARARLASQAYTHPEQVQEAIERERKYLAQLAAGQVVQIGGMPPRSPQISGMRSNPDPTSLAMSTLELNAYRAQRLYLQSLQKAEEAESKSARIEWKMGKWDRSY